MTNNALVAVSLPFEVGTLKACEPYRQVGTLRAREPYRQVGTLRAREPYRE